MKPTRLLPLAAAAMLPLSAMAHTGGDGGQHHALLGELAHTFEHLLSSFDLLDIILLVAVAGAGIFGAIKLIRRN